MKRIKSLVLLLQFGLLISGLTAFFIPEGVDFISNHTFLGRMDLLHEWLAYVNHGVQHIDQTYPFVWYGTDWMVFAHILLAILFYGLYKDPVRNQWLVHFGLIASVLVFPLAFIMGPIRGIPFFWQFLDCMFGVGSGLILLYLNRLINRLQSISNPHQNTATP